jgi:hypothetical protein
VHNRRPTRVVERRQEGVVVRPAADLTPLEEENLRRLARQHRLNAEDLPLRQRCERACDYLEVDLVGLPDDYAGIASAVGVSPVTGVCIVGP